MPISLILSPVFLFTLYCIISTLHSLYYIHMIILQFFFPHILRILIAMKKVCDI